MRRHERDRDDGYRRRDDRYSYDRGRSYSRRDDDGYHRSRRHRDEEDRSRRPRREEEPRGFYNRGLRDDEEPRGRRRPREEEEEERAPRKPRRSGFSSAPPPGAIPPPAQGPADVVAAAAMMGLVPMIPDANTKPRRELFVGNTPPGTTERMLLDHLNSAMTTMNMTTAAGQALIQCRVSSNFAFVELRSIEECDRALSLTGIPFMGHILKIGRPSKYDGPITSASSWQQLLLEGGFDASAAATAGSGDADKVCRELFIGNTNDKMTETTMRAFLCLVARQLGLVIGPGDPIVSLRLSGHFAFVELRSVDETNAMLQFNGIPFLGSRLRIGRPSKYGTTHKSPHDEPRWVDLLDKFRSGELRPLENQDPEPVPLSREDVKHLEAVSREASRTICLRGILEEQHPDEVPADPDNARRRRQAIADGVINEVRKEGNKFGNVLTVDADNDDIIVKFALLDDAILALATLKYRLFDDRKLDLIFLADHPPRDPPAPGDNSGP